jgi:hypothetical protein
VVETGDIRADIGASRSENIECYCSIEGGRSIPLNLSFRIFPLLPKVLNQHSPKGFDLFSQHNIKQNTTAKFVTREFSLKYFLSQTTSPSFRPIVGILSGLDHLCGGTLAWNGEGGGLNWGCADSGRPTAHAEVASPRCRDPETTLQPR